MIEERIYICVGVEVAVKTKRKSGSEILNFQCFCIMEMFLFSKSIIPEEIKTPRPILQRFSIKTPFKAKKLKICMRPWIRRLFFMICCPRRAT